MYRNRGFVFALLAFAMMVLPLGIRAVLDLPIGSAGIHEWLPDGRATKERYLEFSKRFGGDQVLLASWEGATLDDPRVIDFANKLQPLRPDWVESIVTPVEVIRSLQEPPLELSLDRAQQRLNRTLIGDDGTVAIVIVCSQRGVKHHTAVIDAVRSVAGTVPELGATKLKLVGSVFESYAVDKAAEQSLSQLVIPSSMVALSISWIMLRSWRAVVVVFGLACAGQLMAVSIVYYLGFRFSAVLIVLPTLIFILTLSGAIHLMNYFRESALELDHEANNIELGIAAIRKGRWPCFLSSFTTMLGMGSLITSELVPVREFGVLSSVALGIATLALLAYFPNFVQLLQVARIRRAPNPASKPPFADSCTASDREVERDRSVARARSNPSWLQKIFDGIVAFQMKHANVLSIASVLALVATFGGVSFLQSSTKFCDLFPPTDPTFQDMQWFEEKIGPVASLEILLTFERTNSNTVVEEVQFLQGLQKDLLQTPGVGGVFSAAAYLPTIRTESGMRGAATRGVQRKKLTESLPQLAEKGLLSLDLNATTWRLSARVSALSEVSYGELAKTLQKRVDRFVESSSLQPRVEITGVAPVMHETQVALLSDLGTSFLSAFLLIAPIMMMVVKSIRGGLLIMIPNVLPVAIAFGWMGWMGCSLDIAGILTASIALGIAVDDTLHFVCWYMDELKQGKSDDEAIQSTFNACASAMLQTTMITCGSMFPFLFSGFNPTGQFAKLMISVLLLAVLGDLLLLPALLKSKAGSWISQRYRERQVENAVPSNQNTNAAGLSNAPKKLRITESLDAEVTN